MFKVSKVNLTSKGVLSLHTESQACTCHSPCNRGSHLEHIVFLAKYGFPLEDTVLCSYIMCRHLFYVGWC